MTEVLLGIVTALSTALAGREGLRWRSERKNHNPGPHQNYELLQKIEVTLGRIESRLNDIWTEVRK